MEPDLYEIAAVACTDRGSGGNVLRLEHRFANLPTIDTLNALKDEVAAGYAVLYGEDPEALQVVATRLTNQEVMYATRTAREVEEAYHGTD